MTRYRAAAFVALILALAPVVASVVTTDLFIVSEDDPITEDVYVVSSFGRVEGTIDGDLIISTGDLIISGTVTGDVHALTYGSVHIEEGGVVEGSLRTVTPQVQIDGEIDKDLFVTGISAAIGETGSVGRDVIVFSGMLTVDGEVGRDVRGRLVNATVSGSVGHDIDIAVQGLRLAPGASIDGDVLYRSTVEADIASGTVAGQTVKLPAQSNFIFGVILTLANIIGFLAFVVSGIVLLWLFRATGGAAVEAVEKHPVRTLFVGLFTLIGTPIAVLVLAGTLVGLPLAVVLLVAMMLAFVFGPIPAVGAFGDVIVRRKAGLFGAFVVGAILWRLGIWLIPIVGGLLYLAGLVWGTGGWVLAAWRIRKVRPTDRETLPEALVVKDEDDLPEDWQYPLPPSSSVASSSSPSGGGVSDEGADGGGQADPNEDAEVQAHAGEQEPSMPP
ncbi:MAG: polymer-forming cytoskeletal protein, partial [Actinomycetota bacterium]